ncbi:M48 family metalloprotease [Streptomyces sp. NBC_00365]|uniref:M48 family metalloprotease n=1 Tax=Streptomyces sp. NBC_00365 TaxID=2975726 RepID=UPI002259A349|nr:M48 family metalloprotease [Streptomyces sp. NBC_00365]MCX5097653.1 M48 family metalloprotease [Streptomyces sp. NBC_00365]
MTGPDPYTTFPYPHLTGPHDEDGSGRPGIPSGTVLRFALLAVGMLTATLEMTNTAASLLFADGTGLGCWFAVGDDSAFWRAALAGRTGSPLAESCLTEPVQGGIHDWGYAGTAALLATATVLYWLLPRFRSRRRGLVALEDLEAAFDPAGLRTELDELVTLAGRAEHHGSLDSSYLVLTPPRFVVDCAALDAGAVVFGRARAPVVSLHAGLLTVRSTAPERFRAVVLHELAHIRTMDVGLAYSVLALWRAFLAVVLIPYTVIVGGSFVWAATTGHFPGLDDKLWPAALPELTRQTAKALLLVAAVVLIRAATLRHRELVADVDAVAAGACIEVWEKAAAAEASHSRLRPTTSRQATSFHLAGWALALVRPHPTWQERLRALHRPFTLRGLSPLQYFLIGCTTMISVHTVARVWGPGLGASTVALIAASILFFAVWHDQLRARFANLLQEHGPSPAPGLAFGGGLFLGQFVVGVGYSSRWWPTAPETPVVLLALPLCGALWVGWVDQISHLCLLQGARPRAAVWLTAFPSCLFGVALFQWWVDDAFTAMAGDPFGSVLESLAVELPDLAQTHPITLRVIAGTIQYVGAPATGDSMAFIGIAAWFFVVLVQLPRFYGRGPLYRMRSVTMRAERASFGGVATLGLMCGLAVCVVLFVLLSSADSLLPGSPLPESARRMLLVWWTAMAFWTGSSLAAVLTAIRLGPLWLPRALTAAAVAQATALVGFLGLMSFGGCGRLVATASCGLQSSKLAEIYPVLFETVSLGLLAAALAAVPAALLAYVVRRPARLRPRPPRGRAATPVRTWAVRAGVGLLLTTTVASCSASQELRGDPSLVLRPHRGVLTGESTADRIQALQLRTWESTENPFFTDVLAYHNLADRIIRTTPSNIDDVVAACAGLHLSAERALHARPFPDDDLGHRWTNALRHSVTASEACRTGAASPAPHRAWPTDLAVARTEALDIYSATLSRLVSARMRSD